MADAPSSPACGWITATEGTFAMEGENRPLCSKPCSTRDCAAMEIPASLQHRIELFRETGRVFHVPPELFAENSWIQVMLAQGIQPRHYHPTADLMEDPELTRFLETIRSQVERTVSGLPTHQAYLRQYCPAQPPA